MITSTKDEKISLYEEIITRQLQFEVEKSIRKFVEKDINKQVKKLAAEAVRAWSMNMAIQKDANLGFHSATNIQINFVENIIKTIQVPNDISIEVHK